MTKLLSAEFRRLWRSRVFWTLELLLLAGSSVLYFILVRSNLRLHGPAWLENNAGGYFSFPLLYIGAAISVLASLFVGVEHTDRTIRNKLIVGHRRGDIYLAEFAVVASAGAIFALTHLLPALWTAVPVSGLAVLHSLACPGWTVFCGCLTVLVYTAIFLLPAMLDDHRARSAVISLVLALVLIALGVFVTMALQEPEKITQMVLLDDGSLQPREGVPNSRYVSGALRGVLEGLSALLPSSQAMELLYGTGRFSAAGMLCLPVLTGALTGLGAALFIRKDVK